MKFKKVKEKEVLVKKSDCFLKGKQAYKRIKPTRVADQNYLAHQIFFFIIIISFRL